MRFAMCKKEDIVRKDKKVCIIGAGPAGLTAAGYLICKGYQVDVYDRLPEPGGLLIFGIPDFRFNKQFVLKGIKELYELGVKFILQIEVGKNITIEDLINKYDAVIISTGTWKSRELNIPGSNLDGILHALEFLVDVALAKKGYKRKNIIPSLSGSRVAVIGGGNTAMDAARYAIRDKAKEVIILYRRNRESAPAGKAEIKEAEKEGVKFLWLTSPCRFIGDKENRLKAIELVKMKLGEIDHTGRPRPIPIKGSEFIMEFDKAIIAIGEIPTPPFNDEEYGIKLTRRGTILTDDKGRTTRKGVFAAGDVTTGPSLVGLAMMRGKKVAKSVHEYLETNEWPTLEEIISSNL